MTTPSVAEVVARLRKALAGKQYGPVTVTMSPDIDDVAELLAAYERVSRELAELRNRPCPYVHSSGEGTHYCTLPHAAEKELAELRKRVAEAPRGMVRGFMLEPETQPGWLDKMGGKRVAILPLREGE